ncbi:M20 family metallopeptidase [Sporobolomyces koalae]|uniref:M20 family metallopeptidase n=1 Tax=Sporobolomyces koalae TaxID=500713 RepID=UPI00317927CD
MGFQTPVGNLPLPSTTQPPTRSRLRYSLALLCLLPGAFYLSFPTTISLSSLVPTHAGCSHARQFDAPLLNRPGASCPAQLEPLDHGSNWDPKADDAYVQTAIDRLRGAVKIRTESFDDMKHTPQEEPRFSVMADLHEYLEKTYPAVYDKLQVEKVQEYGLLITWKGKDESLKPIVLMAHQDTVPVPAATESSWTYPPFSAHVDSEGWIWGRGTADCKNTLTGIFAAFDKLLSEPDFVPAATIILSAGFDEEIGGSRSAAYLAKKLEERYGKDGVGLILDEGFTGVDKAYGTQFARFGVAEKGAVDLKLEVFTQGGHSSVPLGRHTGIGIMSRLLVALEDNPAEVNLKAGNPMLSYLNCAADYGDMDASLKKKVRNEHKWKQLGHELADSDPILRSFLSTSQAIDLINGGVKVNALPEYVTSTINYRIDFLSSLNETLERVSSILEPVASSLNLTYSAYDSSSDDVKNNHVRLSRVSGAGIEPAPLTPTEGRAWDLMAGTARKVFPDAIVAPSAMIANTDTKWTWNLTRNIYRFVPAPLELLKNFHTVDERIHIDAHLSSIAFFYKLIKNTDAWLESK